MKINKPLVIIAGILLIFSAQNPAVATEGSGNIVKQTRSVSGFEKIDINGSGRLYIQQGDNESLEIETDDNLLPLIKTYVRGGVLNIKPKFFSRLKPSRPIIYRLSLKSLSLLRSSGSVDIFSDSLESSELEVVLSGSSDSEIDRLVSNTFNLTISGSGEITIKHGQINNQTISISGSGVFLNRDSKSDNVSVEVSGSGSAIVWVTDVLNIEISGSGNLSYYGRPKINSDISGSGIIRNLGEK
jgi:Putative auto-transporter adhesin, head GIN domain